jgi:rRNA maturation protein Nop10
MENTGDNNKVVNFGTTNNITPEEKKINSESVTLPSGHWVELRGMKTQEMDILANKKQMRDGEGINDIAKNCIMSHSEGFDYDAALQGDRYLIIIAIRRITYKGPYTFEIPECPECGDKHEFHVNLKDLPITMLNNRPTKDIEFTLPVCGRKVKYHLPTGLDEAELMKVRKQYPDNIITLSLMVNTDWVEGMGFKDIEFFKNLDAEDVLAYQEDLNAHNCGVETTLSLKCPVERETFETELPITKDFFLPKKAKKL